MLEFLGSTVSLPVCHRILTRKLLSDGLVLRLQAEQEFYLVTVCRFSQVR